eukprot:TRINITY_DN32896_c0_g1_i1.p1 TRINITY_DN32896_c0_g1~~TRINITY_DN32896_c0_g1_i1.p1  ORF type:complete len:240 (+),score=58.53 TRINITY_DN32896_c0_g1_i1:94-720(+)
MAVPRRRNGLGAGNDPLGLLEDSEEEDLEGWVDVVEEDENLPSDLRALADAAKIGDVDALRWAIENLNGSIDQPLEDGDTALHLCCLYGYMPCVQLLLEKRASLDSKDEDGALPLHDACAGGYTVIVQLLLNACENQEHMKRMLAATDIDGDTPLHNAARGDHLEVVHLLLSAGASPTATNISGKMPGDLAEPNAEVWHLVNAAVNTQ